MTNRLLKSLIAGILGALAAGLLAILAVLALVAIRMWLATRSESAGIGAVSVAIPGLGGVIAAATGFAIGFYWRFRRAAGRS